MYPNTTLPDVQDQDFGGKPANAFGVPAFQWVNSVLQSLSSSFLTYTRVPYTTEVFTVGNGVIAGDVAALDIGTPSPGGAYIVERYNGSMATPIIVGVFLEAASTAVKARVAIAGVIPPTITGLGAVAGNVGLNATTGRLRIAVPGDLIVGRADPQGNLLFTGHQLNPAGDAPYQFASGTAFLFAETSRVFIPTPNTLFLGGLFDTPSPAAVFQVNSTTQGVLFPQMTTTQKLAIASPPDGLVVYDTTLHRLSSYDAGAVAWHNYS